MGKIDEVKELLNTLRVAMSIAFGILIILIGSIVKRYDADKIDILFWSGILFALAIIGAIVFIIFKIANKTKEIKDL
jgi:predicted membrane channel-forming protein YqfA (hemolysin III family)